MSGEEIQHRLSPGKWPLEVIQRADRNAGQAGASAVRVSAAQWIAKTDLLFERVNYHVDIRVAAKRRHLADDHFAVRANARDVARVVDLVATSTNILSFQNDFSLAAGTTGARISAARNFGTVPKFSDTLENS